MPASWGRDRREELEWGPQAFVSGKRQRHRKEKGPFPQLPVFWALELSAVFQLWGVDSCTSRRPVLPGELPSAHTYPTLEQPFPGAAPDTNSPSVS